MLAVGRGSAVEVLQRVHFPHSLGQLYTAVTQYLGFTAFGDEYKVMGLAAYGDPAAFAAALGGIVPGLPDGTFRLDLRYFRHLSEGVDMTWADGAPVLAPLFTPALERLLGTARRPGEALAQGHRGVAPCAPGAHVERFFTLVGRS